MTVQMNAPARPATVPAQTPQPQQQQGQVGPAQPQQGGTPSPRFTDWAML